MNYVFRLYVSGHTPNSVRAITSVKRLLEERFPGAYTLNVVDVLKHPELANEDRVLVAPTLLRVSPPPVQRVLGDLTNQDKIITVLKLAAPTWANGS